MFNLAKKIITIAILLVAVVFSGVLYAADALSIPSSGGGLGDMANMLEEPVGIATQLIMTGAIIVGISCLFGAFVRYFQFRINPLANPIGTVFTLLVLGILLLCLPLLYHLINSGYFS